MITVSSGRITTQALISAPAASCASDSGIRKPTVSPRPIAADCLRDLLREGANVFFMSAPYAFAGFIDFAAAWTAVRMRAYVPQRHRLVIAASMSRSLGLG